MGIIMNVIFDMDGLMFDTERVYIAAWDYAGEKLGIGKAGYMIHKTLGMSIAASYKLFKAEFGERYNQDEMRKYTKEFVQKYYDENTVPVKPGLYILLEYLKKANCPMALATSSPKWEVEKHLQDAGLMHYFSHIVCGDMVENSKPAPDIYQKACALLGANPEDCYALEDSRNGLLSAYNAGCKAIMVPDLWQPDKEILSIITAKYDDLLEVKQAFETARIPGILAEMRMLFEIDKKDYDINGTPFIRPSARGIIIKDGKLAMIHSLKYAYYKFPGGGIEENENKKTALIREVLEETGLTVIPQTIKEYGMVHRIQKGDYEDIFIQDNYYYLCDVEDSKQAQALDEYEKQEQFTLEYVSPQHVIDTNNACMSNSKISVMIERENMVVKILLKEKLL